MRGFHLSALLSLRRPWKTYRDGTLFYGDTKTGSKRHALTTKDGNKNFYKGTGSSSIGRHTKHGKYVINWDKVRTFVVPETLEETTLKPYVSSNVPELKHSFKGYKGPQDPELFLTKLKEFINNGKVDSMVSETYVERG